MIKQDRLTEVEIKLAEQERLVEELSSVLAQQWKAIDLMDKKLTVLTKRFLELEETSQTDFPVTKPPHW